MNTNNDKDKKILLVDVKKPCIDKEALKAAIAKKKKALSTRQVVTK